MLFHNHSSPAGQSQAMLAPRPPTHPPLSSESKHLIEYTVEVLSNLTEPEKKEAVDYLTQVGQIVCGIVNNPDITRRIPTEDPDDDPRNTPEIYENFSIKARQLPIQSCTQDNWRIDPTLKSAEWVTNIVLNASRRGGTGARGSSVHLAQPARLDLEEKVWEQTPPTEQLHMIVSLALARIIAQKEQPRHTSLVLHSTQAKAILADMKGRSLNLEPQEQHWIHQIDKGVVKFLNSLRLYDQSLPTANNPEDKQDTIKHARLLVVADLLLTPERYRLDDPAANIKDYAYRLLWEEFSYLEVDEDDSLPAIVRELLSIKLARITEDDSEAANNNLPLTFEPVYGGGVSEFDGEHQLIEHIEALIDYLLTVNNDDTLEEALANLSELKRQDLYNSVSTSHLSPIKKFFATTAIWLTPKWLLDYMTKPS